MFVLYFCLVCSPGEEHHGVPSTHRPLWSPSEGVSHPSCSKTATELFISLCTIWFMINKFFLSAFFIQLIHRAFICHLARMDLSFPFQSAANELQRCCNLIVTAMLHCLTANSLTSFLFLMCSPGSPEGGGLYWQVLGIHVWAEHPCNVSLCHLSPLFWYFLKPSFLLRLVRVEYVLFSQPLPLHVLSVSCSFHSISLHLSCIHIAMETGRFSFLQLWSLIKIIPCSPPLLTLCSVLFSLLCCQAEASYFIVTVSLDWSL